jgi:energy-coupling factor transporter ATP-binding protein EcfA2
MDNSPNDISFFAQTNARRPFQRFGIRQADRLQHMYLIGQTGTGKSTLMETLALQDIEAGRGVAVIDPHGDLAERLVQQVPPHRRKKLCYLNATDLDQPYGYNPLRGVSAELVPLAASGLLEALQMLWPEAWGVRMEHVLRNALFALIEHGEMTLPDLLRMLGDQAFRRRVLRKVKNEQVLAFWQQEYPHYNPRYRQESISPIQNKVGALLADPRLHRIFVAPPVDLHFGALMDRGGILIVNLAKGQLGPDSARLLGAMLVTTISLAALCRAKQQQERRRAFFVYVDEFQSFTTRSVASMVSELRKFGVGLVLANQHLDQLDPEIRSSVLGNVGALIAFRLGVRDAALIAPEFEPVFNRTDLMNLANFDIYLRLMIDGRPSQPFSATTLRPFPLQENTSRGPNSVAQ